MNCICFIRKFITSTFHITSTLYVNFFFFSRKNLPYSYNVENARSQNNAIKNQREQRMQIKKQQQKKKKKKKKKKKRNHAYSNI